MQGNNQRGAVLIAALIIMSMILMMSLSLSQIALKGTANTRQIERSEVALAAAEGAVQDILVRIKRDPAYGQTATTEQYALGDATIEVTTAPSDTVLMISAVARVARSTVHLDASYDTVSKSFSLSQVAP